MPSLNIRGNITLNTAPPNGDGDVVLARDASTGAVGLNTTVLNGSLTAGQLLVGNALNVATPTTITGDVTINSSGVTAIGSGVIVNADVHASAAIAVSKLAALTVSRAVVSDSSGFLSTSAATSTEIGYLNGVTSAIQTQIDAKQATITGAATTIVTSNLTSNRAVIANGAGKIDVSATTSTELGYVSGVTSAIQTQIDGKLSVTLTSPANGDIIYHNGASWVNLPRGTNGQALYSTGASIQWDTPTINGIPVGGTDGQVLAKQSSTDFDATWETLTVSSIPEITATAAELNILDGATLTTTELNYVDGVTSSIQSQLDSKQSSSLPQNSIWVGNSSGLAAALAAGTSGYVLTSVAGTPTWQPVSAGSTPGSDTQVLFNDSGSFGADAGLVFDKTNDALTIGVNRIHSTGTSNVFVGQSAGNFTLTGGQNVAVGSLSTDAITSGNRNTSVGYNTMGACTTGSDNTAIGRGVLPTVTVGSRNTGVGSACLNTTTGDDNTSVGYNSLISITTGSQNTGVGSGVGNNITTGSQNVTIGYNVNAQSATANGQLSIQNAIFGTNNIATGTTASTGKIGILAPAPNSTLHVAGSFTLPYVEKSATYTASDTDYVINCTSGSFTINLPTAVGIAGRMYVIKNSTGGGTITIDPSGAETIDGLATTTVVGAQKNVIMSTGSNWIIIGS